MLLQQLVELGLVTPTNKTGTFATLPYAARVTIATTVISHLHKDMDQHCVASLRSPDDVHCILESIGPVFSFVLPDCEALMLQALTVYEWILNPKNAASLPAESFTFGTVRRAEIMRDMFYHISQAFQPQSGSAAVESQRTVILHAINTLSTIMTQNAKVLIDPDSPAWTALIHVSSAAISCHAANSNAFAECRGALASIQLEALLRSRTRNKLLWALAGDSHGRHRVPVSVARQWRAAVQTLARTLAAASVSQPNPEAYRIDWVDMAQPVRRTTGVSEHHVTDASFALTSCLDMLGPLHLIESHDALHEVCLGVGDGLVLLAGAPLWPALADDEGGTRRFLYYSSPRESAVLATRTMPPGPSTPILTRLFGTTLVLVHRTLPASPSSGVPATDAEITVQRIKVVATERLCAAFLRPESIDLPDEQFLPFLATLIASLEDPSPVVQGTALTASLPLYGTLLPRRFPPKLATAIIIAASSILSPHLVHSSTDVISVQQQGGSKAYTVGGGGDDDLEDVEIIEGSRSTLLTSMRIAAAAHLSNCVAVSNGRDTESLVLSALLRATADFRFDEAVLTAVLSSTTLVFAHLSESLIAEAPRPPEHPAAGPHFELVASIIDQVTKRLSPSSSAEMIPAVMHFLRELPLDSALLSKGIVESLAEFALSMRRTLDSATTTAMARKSGGAASATLAPLTAAHLFALACHSILRVLDRQHSAWGKAKGSSAAHVRLDSASLMKDSDTLSIVLQVVDAGLKGINGHNYAVRDAAEALLNGVFLVRQYPLSARNGAFHSNLSEVDFLADAQCVKAFAVGNNRIVTALQCVSRGGAAAVASSRSAAADAPAAAAAADDGSGGGEEYVALIIRDAAGTWTWTFSRNDDAPRVVGFETASKDVEAVLAELVPLPIPPPGDILARTSVDAERHDAVIARWKVDPPLAAALKAMEASEAVAARAAAADTAELLPAAPGGRATFQESGTHTGLMRQLLSDIGFVSSRTKVLRFDDEFVSQLRAIDRASPLDTVDVLLLRVVPAQRDDDDDDARRFEAFCASLGILTHASGDTSEYVHASPSFGVLRFHARKWCEADDLDGALAPQVMRLIWDGTGRDYYHCATPTVLTSMYQQLTPQWRVPTRSVIDVLVSPLQKEGRAGGYLSVRVLAPVYAQDDEVVLPGQLAAPFTPLVASIVQVPELPRLLRAVVHAVSTDKFNSAPLSAVTTAQFARKRLLERAVASSLVAPDFNDQVGTHVLAALLVN